MANKKTIQIEEVFDEDVSKWIKETKDLNSSLEKIVKSLSKNSNKNPTDKQSDKK